MKRMAIAAVGLALAVSADVGCRPQEIAVERVLEVTPTAEPVEVSRTAEPVDATLRRFESSQGYEVDVPSDWAIVPNILSGEPGDLGGSAVSGDTFIAPGRGISIAQAAHSGEIDWEEYGRQASQLADWAAIAVVGFDWPYGSMNMQGEIASLGSDPEDTILGHEEIVVDGREALLYYYTGPAPGMTGLWDHATVLVVSKGRYWGMGLTTSLGRLQDFLPVFETAYTSFDAR